MSRHHSVHTSGASTSPILAAALRHAAAGRPVFPVAPENKQPLVQNGFYSATVDRRRIERWFGGQRAPMIGLPTGRTTGLVVLDVDGEAGAESLRQLERRHGELPSTASVATPSGGQHYYFPWPGVRVITRAPISTDWPGVDIRGDGGYVVVPPSVRADGRAYVIDSEVPMAPMPAWVLKVVRERPGGPARPPVQRSEWLRIVRDGLGEGERNQGLARLVGHLLRRYVDVDMVAELAYRVNAGFRPPLDRKEVDRIVDSIAGRELRRRQKGGGAL